MHVLKKSVILAQNLRRLRAERGLSQEQLASLASITTRNYQSLEAGKGNPTLLTLSGLAKGLKITSGKLICLEQVRTQDSPELFLERFHEAFENSAVGAYVRTLDGVLQYRNQKFRRTFHFPERESGTVDLLEVLPAGSREILRCQLASERRGLVSPYVNFSTDAQTTELLYCRMYPSLVFFGDAREALFTATYATEITEDCEKNYFEFCQGLLSSLNMKTGN